MNADNNDNALIDHAGEAADKLEQQREEAITEMVNTLLADEPVTFGGDSWTCEEVLTRFFTLFVIDEVLDDYIASQKDNF